MASTRGGELLRRVAVAVAMIPAMDERAAIEASDSPRTRASLAADLHALGVTPSNSMGAVPEIVRSLPGAKRSAHPQTSFAAVGTHAELITADHQLESGMGEQSPLRRLYDLNASILLLGTGHANNSSFHLAEYRVSNPRHHSTAAAASTAAGRQWTEYDEVELDSGDFEALGAAFDATGGTRLGRVGSAECRLLGLRDAVDFAVHWLDRERS